MKLLRLSRASDALDKAAQEVVPPDLSATLPKDNAPHGLEGRLVGPSFPGAKLKQTQGPRAYAPRLQA